MVNREPWLASVPALGFCLTTVFGGAVEFWSVTSLTWNPLFTSALCASGSDWPTTPGTLTFGGPVETLSVTVVPRATRLPSAGLALITSPFCTVAEGVSTTLGTSPAFCTCWVASATGRLVTWGTATPPLPPKNAYATPPSTASTSSAPSAQSSHARRLRPPPGWVYSSSSGPYS